jgi:hypothetical protein
MFKDCLDSSSKAKREEKTKKKNMSKKIQECSGSCRSGKIKVA